MRRAPLATVLLRPELCLSTHARPAARVPTCRALCCRTPAAGGRAGVLLSRAAQPADVGLRAVWAPALSWPAGRGHGADRGQRGCTAGAPAARGAAPGCRTCAGSLSCAGAACPPRPPHHWLRPASCVQLTLPPCPTQHTRPSHATHAQPDDLSMLLSALTALGCGLTPGLLGAAADVALANMGSFSVARVVDLMQVRVCARVVRACLRVCMRVCEAAWGVDGGSATAGPRAYGWRWLLVMDVLQRLPHTPTTHPRAGVCWCALPPGRQPAAQRSTARDGAAGTGRSSQRSGTPGGCQHRHAAAGVCVCVCVSHVGEAHGTLDRTTPHQKGQPWWHSPCA
jgi:hypothetical protein